MPIVTPRRRYVRYNSFTRNRYSNFYDWLVQEAARLGATARGVRDKLAQIGTESPTSVEAATDATPSDISLVTTSAVAGAGGKGIASGTVTDPAATFATLGIANGDTVEIIYGGTDNPTTPRYFGVVSSIAETSFDVDPAPPDLTWTAATTEVTISVIDPDGRE